MGKELQASVTWLGHATFLIETPGGKRVLIDPFLASNPSCPPEYHELADVDLILCTHGHNDHIADLVAVAKRSGAQVGAMIELADWAQRQGVQHTTGWNKGGTVELCGIKVTMVTADHSSSFNTGDDTVYLGEAAGFVIELEDGYRIYHAGDTSVFGDMRLIGDLYSPDLALLPIGGHFTMDPREAALAVALLGVKEVVGMHYGTMPVLTGTPAQLREELGSHDVTATVHELQPGESLGKVAAAAGA